MGIHNVFRYNRLGYFRAESLGIAINYIGYMFCINNQSADFTPFLAMLYQSITVITIGIICSTPIFKIMGQKIKENFFTNLIYACMIASIFVLSVSSLVSSSYNPFIYFNF